MCCPEGRGRAGGTPVLALSEEGGGGGVRCPGSGQGEGGTPVLVRARGRSKWDKPPSPGKELRTETGVPVPLGQDQDRGTPSLWERTWDQRLGYPYLPPAGSVTGLGYPPSNRHNIIPRCTTYAAVKI